jgi:ppGpp synthetase/RelA/SpoT-type nucleotidyltranferase
MTADPTEEKAVNRSVQKFERTRHLYEKLEGVVVYDLKQVLRERDLITKIDDDGVSSRVKDVDSFRGKIARKNYAEPLADTRDLLGVRIVCLYPSVLEEIDKVINETFTVVGYEDKGNGAEPELWRYSSKHYDCQLPESFSGLQYDDIKGLVFEIQVRTILQDAWATVEHKLGYKPEKPVPDELKREFSALAGLFHVADQRFQFIADRMKLQPDEIAQELSGLYGLAIEHARSGNASTEEGFNNQTRIKELESRSGAVINRGSIKALLHGMYPGRRHMKNPDYTGLVQDLASVDVTRLGDLGRLLVTGDAAAREPESERAPLSDVAFARTALASASPKFRSKRQRRRAP